MGSLGSESPVNKKRRVDNNIDEEVKLLNFWASPFSKRVEIGLKLKGISYESVEQDLQNKTPELLKYNPVHKKVPVLLHNGKPITESRVILEYIDEVWPGDCHIMPQDPYDRAMARFWAKFIDDQCQLSLWNAVWAPKDEQDKALKEAHENLTILEKEMELQGKKFFGGDNVGFVDIIAIFIGYWLGVIQEAGAVKILTEERYPCLWKWAQDFASDSIVKGCLPPREKLVASFKNRLKATSI